MRSTLWDLGAMALALLTAGSVFAQNDVTVRGQILYEQGTGAGPLDVSLEGMGADFRPRTVAVTGIGDFEFDSVPTGDYTLVVADARGTVLHREYISVGSESYFSIRLRTPRSAGGAPGIVSLRELQRKIPHPAEKEWKKGRRALEKRKLDEAVTHFQKAIAIYPDYPEAHATLGLCYAGLNRVPDGLAELQKAQQLAPGSAVINASLGMLWLQTRQYKDAERAARSALRLNPALERAEFVLGVSLAAMHRESAEALRSLQRVAPRFPFARLAAAQILEQSGRAVEAAAELHAYLKSPEASKNRQVVESWLGEIEHTRP